MSDEAVSQLSLAPYYHRRFESLKKAVLSRRTVPVVGSVLSQGLPSWLQLLDGLAEELPHRERSKVRKLLKQEKYLEAASELETSPSVGRTRVVTRIQDLYRRPASQAPSTYDLLARMPSDALITTNYDPWLKNAVSKAHHQAPPEYVPGQGSFPDFTQGGVPYVLMIHGDADNPSTCVLSERGYAHLTHGNPALKAGMAALVAQRQLVFIGHSASDPDIIALLDEWSEIFGQGGGPTRHFWLGAGISANQKRRLRERLIEPIDYGDHAQLPAVLQWLAKGEETSPHSAATHTFEEQIASEEPAPAGPSRGRPRAPTVIEAQSKAPRMGQLSAEGQPQQSGVGGTQPGAPPQSSALAQVAGGWDKRRVILHLSDLHFGSAANTGHYWNSEGKRAGLSQRDQPDLLRYLVRDLQSPELKEYPTDVVVVSGDLLNKGDPSGVDLAIDFLTRLAEELRLDQGHFILAPGNHDIDRSRNGAEQYRHFDRLRNEFYSKDRAKPKRSLIAMERCEFFPFHELGLEFVAFNTCENLGAGNEHGSVGETQRTAAEKQLGAGEPAMRIAVMHHHLHKPPGVVRDDYSVMDDAGLIDRWLAEKRFSLVLHGHQHVDWLQRTGTGTRDILVTAAGSLGVSSYGRKDWSLPLQYQLIVLESPTHGVRLRREYDEQHRTWCAAGRGQSSEPFRLNGSQPPQTPTPAGPTLVLTPSFPRIGGRTSIGGTHRFRGQLDRLIALCSQERRTVFERYRSMADHDEVIDLRQFVGDANAVLSSGAAYSPEFKDVAASLVFELAYALAEHMEQANELKSRGLEPQKHLLLPVETYLFAEIVIAYVEERGRITPTIDRHKGEVVGKNAVIWSGLDCAAHGDDALLGLERALWSVLNATEGTYSPTCPVSLQECESRRNSGFDCKRGCHRTELHGLLEAGAFEHNRAHVFIEKHSEQEASTMAERLKHVILVQFGGAPVPSADRISEAALAALIKKFIRLTQTHLGAS